MMAVVTSCALVLSSEMWLGIAVVQHRYLTAPVASVELTWGLEGWKLDLEVHLPLDTRLTAAAAVDEGRSDNSSINQPLVLILAPPSLSRLRPQTSYMEYTLRGVRHLNMEGFLLKRLSCILFSGLKIGYTKHSSKKPSS